MTDRFGFLSQELEQKCVFNFYHFEIGEIFQCYQLHMFDNAFVLTDRFVFRSYELG